MGAAYVVSNSMRVCANQCKFAIRTPLCVLCVCVFRMLLPTAPGFQNSSRKGPGSSRPRASEAAYRGKHAYPDSELKIAENLLDGGASLASD